MFYSTSFNKVPYYKIFWVKKKETVKFLLSLLSLCLNNVTTPDNIIIIKTLV